jgi:chromosome segregation ATPase
MPMRDDELSDQDMPSITPEQDELALRSGAYAKKQADTTKKAETPAQADHLADAQSSAASTPMNAFAGGAAVPPVVHPAAGRARGLPVLAQLLILVLMAVFFIVAGLALYQQLEHSQKALLVAEERITQLEKRLSSTDESMSQSSVSMQVRIKDLTEKTDKLWEQMDKLWASAWRRNQEEIGNLILAMDKLEKSAATIKKDNQAQAKSVKEQSEAVKQQVKQTQALEKQLLAQIADLKKMDGELESLYKSQKSVLEKSQGDVSWLSKKISKTEESVSQLNAKQQALESSSSRLLKAADAQDALEARVQSNEGWVKSINTHRKQVNAQIKQLQDSVRKLQAGGSAVHAF